LPAEAADAIALWVAAAWSLDAAQISPILAIVAASMRCGKSTCAEIVASVSPRALMVASLTPAVLFRLIDEYHPTLVADEADTWLLDEKSELRGIWNAGHSRSTAVVARCEGDDNRVKLYSTFAPRVLAMIGRPPATILDRSIVVELKRKRTDERVDRLRRDQLEVTAAALRRRWRRWADDQAEQLIGADPNTPADLNDRAADNWRHLLSIADLAGDTWPGRARRAAMMSVEATADDGESIGVDLLADVRCIFEERAADAVASADIVAALVGMDGRPWAEWSQGRPLTTAKLARLLKPFKVYPVDVRLPAGVKKSYTKRSLFDAWSRYLPSKAQHRDNTNVYGPESQKTKAQQNDPCCPSESATNPIETGEKRDCCGVALSTAENGLGEELRDGSLFV
jgi:putative DNA primase/helicase